MAKKGVAKRGYRSSDAYFALALATSALIINFWAWSLLSPLGTRYADELSLSVAALSFLLAVPVLVGSVGRIVLGAITDRFGGKLVFGAACLVAILPVSALAFSSSYEQLLAAAVLLGIGGATFVIGVPFISAWFPVQKRGFVLGIYSMGNIGTAVSGVLTPQMDTFVGRRWTFLLVATLLLMLALVFFRWAKNAPSWKPPTQSALKRFAAVSRNRITWDLAFLYVITFGALVAFGVYLPVLLRITYDLSVADAAARAAGFVLVATAARPIGGWLSDHIGGHHVIRMALLSVVLLSVVVAFQPTLEIQTTAAYLGLAFALGCSNGAIVALVGKLARPDNIGSIMGVVGAVGGLGGFFPPLILGITYQKTSSYSLALLLLAVSAMLVFFYISQRFKSPAYSLLRIRAR